MNIRNISGMLLCCKTKSQSGVIKLNRKQELYLVCGFVASSRALIFAATGCNTINN